MVKSNKDFATEAMNDIRRHAESMHPDDCCEKGLMVESGPGPNGVERMLCVPSCQWSKLHRLIAVAMVDVEVAIGSGS